MQEGNKKALELAATYGTALWGGIYNPIIPISASDRKLTSRAHELVEQYQVDVLYPVTNNKAIQKFIANYPELEWENYKGQLVRPRGKKEELNVFDVLNIMQRDYDTFASMKPGESSFALTTWGKDDPERLAYTLSYGQYPKLKGNEDRYEYAYKKVYKPKELYLETDTEKPENLFEVWHRTDLTDVDLTKSNEELGGMRFGIFVGSQSSFRDLINFWNIRATNRNVRFIAIENIKSYTAPLKSIEKHFTGYPYGIWLADGQDEKDVKPLLDEMGLNSRAYMFTHIYPQQFYPKTSSTYTEIHADEHSVMADDDLNKDHNTVSFALPELPFKTNKGYTGQQLVVEVVNRLVTYDRADHLLELPYLKKLNRWYGRNLKLDLRNFRINPQRLSFIEDDTKHIFRLNPIKRSELFEELYRNAGLKTQANSPNTLAQKIIDQMGGIQSCRVFKITGVRKVLVLPSGKAVSEQELTNLIRDYDETLRKNTFEDFKDLYIEARTSQELTIADTIDYLLKKKVIQAGFLPQCPNCNLKPWVTLENAADHVACEYCGNDFKLALAVNRKKNSFYYRKSGLFSPSNHQEGVVTTLVAIQTLNLKLEPYGYSYEYALDLKQNKKQLTDIDFTVLELSQQRNINNHAIANVVAVSECKTNKEITYSEMKKLLSVKKSLDESGLRAKLLFAKLTDFTPKEIANIKKLKLKDDEIIMLSRAELEVTDLLSYYVAYKVNGKELPEKYPHNLDALAINTKAIYLS